MKCDHVQEQLFHYIDEELSAEASKRIRDHLGTCGECKQKLLRYRETHKALKNFGSAIRAGWLSIEPPPLPEQTSPGLWEKIFGGLKTPVPVWIPSAASVAVILMFALATFSPLNLSIEWGKQKGGGDTGVVEPPLSAQGMLEFLIVPSPTAAGQLAASIETVETFLLAHPNDLAMHAKLVELYEAQLKLGSLSESARAALSQKLSMERERFLKLLKEAHLTKGDENVEK